MRPTELLVLLGLGLTRAMPSSGQSDDSSMPLTTTEINLCPCNSSPAVNVSSASFPQQPQQQQQQQHHQPQNSLVHGMTCMCHTGPSPPARDDYHYSPGIGAHKLHTRAATWNNARKMCNDEGGHLAIVNSNIEAHVLKGIFEKSGPVKGASYGDMALIGIHDLYKEGEWVTVQGESLFKTGYTIWSDKWGGQPDNGGGNQNCAVFLKEGGLDDVNCEVPFAFFCELPLTYIIH